MGKMDELYALDFGTVEEPINPASEERVLYSVEPIVAQIAGRVAVANSDLYDIFSAPDNSLTGQDSFKTDTDHEEAEPIDFVEETPVVGLSLVEPFVEKKVIEPSEAMLAKAQEAVGVILASGRMIVPAAFITSSVFPGQKVDREAYEEFKEALKRSEVLDYLGKGQFGVRELLTPESYWPGQIDDAAVEAYLNSAVDVVLTQCLRSFNNKIITGILKGVAGYYLNSGELGKFFSLLTAHPSVIAMEDGSYRTRLPDLDGTTLVKTEDEPLAERRATPKDVRARMHEINKSPEVRQAKELAVNKADTRKHGHNFRRKSSRMMGKLHGKKLTVEQMIAKMNKPTTG